MQDSLYEFTLKGDDGDDKQYVVMEEAKQDDEIRYLVFEGNRVIGILIGKKIKVGNNSHFRFVLWNALECYDQLSDDGRVAVDEALAYLNANYEA